MAMRPKLWSLNGLSVELGIGARALAKKLKQTPPDGKVGGREGWYMSSAVSAIKNDRGGNGGGYGGSDRGAVLDEIQWITAKLDAGFSQMAAEPDVARRRKIATEVGPLVGALNRAIEPQPRIRSAGRATFRETRHRWNYRPSNRPLPAAL
jgi:hypothetical protein